MQQILISGSRGLVGSELSRHLQQAGHQVTPLVRNQSQDGVLWNPSNGEVDLEGLEQADVVVHLAGESIAEGRWSAEKKRRIVDSRVEGTELLCRSLAKLQSPPKVLISASAIGYYGNRGDEGCDESSSPGEGFLAETSIAWEEATRPAVECGIRVVNFRIGIVLSPDGGALGKMLLPFRLGLGGKLGPGTQYLSWISLRDLVRAIEFCIQDESLRGPVNGVAPNPATNAEFTRALGTVLRRPTMLPVPAFALRTIMGEMADQMLLAGACVFPKVLEQAGFKFLDPELIDALKHELGQTA